MPLLLLLLLFSQLASITDALPGSAMVASHLHLLCNKCPRSYLSLSTVFPVASLPPSFPSSRWHPFYSYSFSVLSIPPTPSAILCTFYFSSLIFMRPTRS